MRVGVVGATGQVGGVMRKLLAQRDFPIEEIRFAGPPAPMIAPPSRDGAAAKPWKIGEMSAASPIVSAI